MFASIGLRLVELMHSAGYIGLFVATFLENIIPPIPSEVIMPLGGYLAATGKMNIILVILIGTLGSTCGTLPYYLVGRWMSYDTIHARVAKYGSYIWYNTTKLDNLYEIFNKHDTQRVFFARFLPGARSLISLPAGSAGMARWSFFGLSFAGTFLWTTLWTLIGYFFGDHQDLITGWFGRYERRALVGLVLLVIAVIYMSVRKNKKQ